MSAATGTLVAASLETVGYKAQALVLQSFGGTLEHLAVFVYLACAVAALITIVISGQYRLGLWFIIAPTLYHWVVLSRAEGAGVDWQFGRAFQGDQKQVEAWVGGAAQYKSSWFFHRYNEIISGLYQDLISVITNEDLRKQMMFMTRQRMMDEIMQSEIGDPALESLAKISIGQRCKDVMTAAADIAYANREPNWHRHPRYLEAVRFFREEYGRSNVNILPGSTEYQALYDVITHAPDNSGPAAQMMQCKSNFTKGATTTIPFNNPAAAEVFLHHPISCEQIWCLTGLLLMQEAQGRMKKIENKYVNSSLPADKRDQIVNEMWQNVATKLTPARFMADTEHKDVVADISYIPVAISGIMLARSLQSDWRSRFYDRLAKDGRMHTDPFNYGRVQSDPEVERYGTQGILAQNAEGGRFEIFTFAMLLPYAQGAFLYFLALSFPFFALFILIPGKAGAFMNWFMLWAWAKSWDVGWALVMVVDDILWEIMPHYSAFRPDDINAASQHQAYDPQHSPLTIAAQAFQFDAAYSTANYYTLLGVMLTAVPMLAGQMVLGARYAIAGTFIDGIRGFANSLGSSAADAYAFQQLAAVDYRLEQGQVAYAATRMHSAANPQVAKLEQEINRTDALGRNWRAAGKALLPVGVGVGIFLNPIAGVAIAAASPQVFKRGLNMQRAAFDKRRELISTNAQIHLANSNYSPQVQTAIKQINMLTNRGEYYRMQDAPTEHYATVQKMTADLQNKRAEQFSEILGRGVSAAIYRARPGMP